jgi:hypothetical protein
MGDQLLVGEAPELLGVEPIGLRDPVVEVVVDRGVELAALLSIWG